jgi:hypothetical protein
VRGRLLLVFCLLAAVFSAAGLAGRAAAPTSITFGVTEDATKYADDGGAKYFQAIHDLGMVEDRVIVYWDENTPRQILEQDFLDRMMPVAAKSGVNVVFAIQPLHARAFAVNTDSRIAAFADYVRLVALRYPQVRDYVIGNEPNTKRFWQPQHSPDGKIVSAGTYEQVLAAAYDALKGVDPTVRVEGPGTTPGGNDGAYGVGDESVSPVRFIAALGAAYRASGRKAPLVDLVDVHSYSAINNIPLTQPRKWPQAGPADLDRLKQAWWDAFHGTGQPLFQETGDPATGTYVKFRIDESGTQVQIDPTKVNPSLYTGKENVPVVSEATQAKWYTGLINLIKCDPDVATLDLFHLIDEPALLGFQSGLLRVDGSKRPSYAAVQKAIAAAGTCPTPHTWKHTTTVIGVRGSFDLRDKTKKATGFPATVLTGEEVSAVGGVFPLTSGVVPSNAALRQAFAGGPFTPVLRIKGLVKANSSRTFKFKGRLQPGRYVYAFLVSATMNPARTKLLVSGPFTVLRY